MRSFSFLSAAAGAAALLAAPAAACPPPAYYPLPLLPGETEETYRARIEQQARRDAEAQLAQAQKAQLAREDALWRTAEQIVVVEVTGVARVREDRDGRPYQTMTMRPVVSERGRGAQGRFRLRRDNSGSMCIAPAGLEYPSSGVLVLFARKGKLSDATVMDWTNAGRSTHPQTLALLARASRPRD